MGKVHRPQGPKEAPEIEPKQTTSDVAKKQRILALLQKMKVGQPLAPAEIREVKAYEAEQQALAAQQPKRPRLGKEARREKGKLKRKKKAKKKAGPRLPITPEDVKRLAFAYSSMAEADQQAGTRRALATVLDKHPVLMAAWHRGELLRRLQASASVVDTIHEAARDLGFPRGQDLRDWLDEDQEALNLWDETRFSTRKRVRAAMIKAAEDGNQKAIGVVEAFLQDDSAAEKVDFSHLTTQQMVELTGKARQTFHEWVTKRGLPRNGDKTFDLKAFLAWYEEFLPRKIGAGGKVAPADPWKAVKTEKEIIRVQQMRAQLLDRAEVVVGLCARYQVIIDWFNRTLEDIVRMVYGQNHEETRALMIKWFNDGRRQWTGIPEQLQLNAEHTQRLQQLLLELEPAETTEGP